MQKKMSKMSELDLIAQGVADHCREIMYDTVEWQLGDFEQDGDEYNDIHSEVMFRAIEKMWFEIKKSYYEHPLEQLPGYMGTERG